jgi:DNA topoisomerase-1
VAREKAIRYYVPTPYWTVKAEAEIADSLIEADYEKGVIKTKKEANRITYACKGKNGEIEKIDVKRFQQLPPAPFDLGTLQSEAYSLFGYTPMRTSNIAQRLYLDALISYPRTSSQKLPRSINYGAILKDLNRAPKYKELAAELLVQKELKPEEGKKEDSAHPAIYPTGNLPERVLDESESNIWDIVVRRFMAVFGESSIMEIIKAYVNVNGHRFFLRGKQTLEEGWARFYKPYVRSEEVLLPPVKEGQIINIKRVILEDRFAKPQSRYNPSSLLKRMEEAGIGTKATRANIIQTLYDRKYVRDERMTVTDLGLEVLEVLRKHCSTVVSVKLTKELEDKMSKIQSNVEKRDNILVDAVEILKPVLEALRRKENIIGERLSNATKNLRLEDRTIGTCPACKTGKLVTLYSRRTGKRFVGCTNYFKGSCRASFPLPQKGAIRPLWKNCRRCGWPMVHVRIKGRRTWTLCFNPECSLKKER